MKTLVITDLHLNTKIHGLLDAQIECLDRIFSSEIPDEIIIMGDIFMSRRPNPSVLLGLKRLLDKFSWIDFQILRGNHDSETKADDGVTALSLYDRTGSNAYKSKSVTIHTHTYIDDKNKRVFIPHYENEEHIVTALRNAPKGYRIFGHFGYFGSINSAGDADFTIALNEFRNTCMLGHIHRFTCRRFEVEGEEHTLTCLGTPYTTNFTEAGKDSYYAVIEDGVVSHKVVKHGPRHLCVEYNKSEWWDDLLTNSDYFNIVRVYVDKLSDSDNSLLAQDLLDKYPISCLEIKYKPIFDEEAENYYNPQTNPFELTRDILEDYVNYSSADLDKEKLLKGLDLINENKKSDN